MHLLFLDESGTPPGPAQIRDKYFVIGGVIVPENQWHNLRDLVFGMKIRRGLVGELKWRYFVPTNTDSGNPMRTYSPDLRNEIRLELYKILRSIQSIRSIACIASIEAAYTLPWVNTREDLYHFTYKPISERFQYYLQDLSRQVGTRQHGIIIADHRGAKDDERFRSAHENFVAGDKKRTSTYSNLIETLFFEPSHLSVGIQFADMVAGAVWRKYEKADERWFDEVKSSLRSSMTGEVDGFGLISFPKTKRT